MGRVLTMRRAMVPATERAAYIAALRERMQHYVSAECRFWAFEANGVPGQFVEFTEATDATVLTAAIAAAPGRDRASTTVYNEVELD